MIRFREKIVWIRNFYHYLSDNRFIQKIIFEESVTSVRVKMFKMVHGYSDHYSREKAKRLKQPVSGTTILPRLCISVTNLCTLKCRDCNNLMPYCKEKYIADIDELKKNIDKILQAVDGIVSVEVIGGEPFVYRHLVELITYLNANEKVENIEITSNGTVLPDENVFTALKNEKVSIWLSDYGCVNSQKAQAMYDNLRKHRIHVINMKNRTWIDAGNLDRRNKNKITLCKNLFNCDANKSCRTLYKNRLYVCGRAPILDELGLLKDKSSYIDIDGIKNADDLRCFYSRTVAEACDFCNYANDKKEYIPSGIQM